MWKYPALPTRQNKPGRLSTCLWLNLQWASGSDLQPLAQQSEPNRRDCNLVLKLVWYHLKA
jgi:hypothetical protein